MKNKTRATVLKEVQCVDTVMLQCEHSLGVSTKYYGSLQETEKQCYSCKDISKLLENLNSNHFHITYIHFC